MNIMRYKEAPENQDVISLFSGAMGLDIGLENAGLNIAVGQDFERACVETMKSNGHRAICGDIREIEASDVLDQAGLAQGEPFLLCGGPPCQPFSTAGKRLGINDPKGSLFMDFIRMLDYIRPHFCIMENVKGITSSPVIEGESGTVLDIILSEFSKLGYKTVYGVLNAVDYGVPQFRERFILIGSRDNEDVFLPYPTHFQKHQAPAYRWRTLRDTIADLEHNCGECATFSQNRMKYLRMISEGGNWRDLPEDI